MKKFWRWENRVTNSEEGTKEENILYFDGTIAEESWYDDEISPQIFKEELAQCNGDITIWINSPGGDCIAAAQIYNMLREFPHSVTAKIDGLAASAATVVAMAADKVCISPVSMFMIHNPSTIAWGDTQEMRKTIDMLDQVKESIMNAYELKTGLDRKKLAKLMDEETWMNAYKAIELGFADEITQRREDPPQSAESMAYSQAAVTNCLKEKIMAKSGIPATKSKNEEPADAFYERLNKLKEL
ncbi:MAG: Clp protease ClpP [Ruminococcus sp.]|nr:Clp protease ClpP [Ruminococcus sp.]